MKQLIEFYLDDETLVIVETDAAQGDDGFVPASSKDRVVVRAAKSFEEALENVKPMASMIIGKLRGLSDSPDEIEVEFGLKMDATAGAFLASASLNANYKVTLKWGKDTDRRAD